MHATTTLPPLTWERALATWTFSLPWFTLLAALAAGYLVAYAWVRGHQRWPVSRVVSFLVGLAVVWVATQGSVGVYSTTLYWLHMVQHLALIMLAPMLLAIGHPLRLASAAAGRHRPTVDALLRSPVVSAVTLPGVTLLLYSVVLVGTHLTGFMRAMGAHPWLHPVESVLYLVTGYLYVVTLVADEPIRWRPMYLTRLVLSLLGMVADTGVGVVLMMTVDHPLRFSGMHTRDWGPAPLDDLHTGGAVMWVFGDGLMLAITVVLAARWLRDTDSGGRLSGWLDAVRRDQVTGHAVSEDTDIDADEAAHDAYNRMLASLDPDRARRNEDEP